MSCPVITRFSSYLAKMPSCLFSRASTLLHQLGFCDLDEEKVFAIGLIVGGTRIQPIHYDVAETEENKEHLANAFSSPYGPATVLLSFSNAIRIVVEKDRVKDLQVQGVEEYGSIVGGVDDERILVVGNEEVNEEKNNTTTTKDIVILESKTGFIIKGDVTHAGAVCYAESAVAKTHAWKKVQNFLMPLEFDEHQRNEIGYRNVFDEFCGVASLDTITRLHFSIGPKDMPNFFIPNDTVGMEEEEEGDDDKNDDANDGNYE